MPKSVHPRAYKVLRERLVAARHAAGLTQQELADKLGRRQSFVAKYERGERRIDLVELLEIATVLNADARRIIACSRTDSIAGRRCTRASRTPASTRRSYHPNSSKPSNSASPVIVG